MQTSGTDEAGAPIFRSVLFSGCSTPLRRHQRRDHGSGRRDLQRRAEQQFGLHLVADQRLHQRCQRDRGDRSGIRPRSPATSARRPTSARSAVLSDTWFRNWTCNSTYADFGSSTGNCVSIPTI
ncbi:hypothetical protein AB5I41_29120 [Sphingomonas sp. MMS24-JH45]